MEMICLMNLYWQKRQNTKLNIVFNNNMSTDETLSKVQISTIIQSGGSLE